MMWCYYGRFDMGDVFEDCPNRATEIVTVRNGPTVTSSHPYCAEHGGAREASLAHNRYRGITVERRQIDAAVTP